MPQMAPLLWFYLFIFFNICLLLFLIVNYFIKPFEKIVTASSHTFLKHKAWKL
uniref:ATP synthase complex subunit 8 n=1 Tax=Oregonia gracilis TaxID=553030 RepID=A0A7U0M9A3_9EUCA|nr:ATP synthase F0 subunit 8 [Oregonia gracilis]QQX28740.1 ATP synthase F0 subunit 8 [Oregonia gracilis]